MRKAKSQKKIKEDKKTDVVLPEKPVKPPNSFRLFIIEKQPEIKEEQNREGGEKSKLGKLSKIYSEKWKTLPDQEKKVNH